MDYFENKAFLNDVIEIIKDEITRYIDCEYPEDYFESRYDIDTFKELDYPDDLVDEIFSGIRELIEDNNKTKKYFDIIMEVDDVDWDIVYNMIYEFWDVYRNEVCDNMSFDEYTDGFNEED